MKYTHGRTVRIRYILQSIPIVLSRKNYDNSYVADYEKKFKEFIGTKYAIATSSARFALYLIFKSFKIEKGKTEIITPAFLPQVVVAVIVKCGLKPVFVDIEPNTLNIDANKIEEKITKNTKFLLAIHLHGIPCDMKKISRIAKKNNLFVIEDCAQAFNTTYHRKKVGNFGHVSVFSTNNFKNFNTCGGGIILTNDKILNDKLRNKIEKLPHPTRFNSLRISFDAMMNSVLGIPAVNRFLIFPLTKLLSYLRILSKKEIEKAFFRGTNFGDTDSIFNSDKFLKLYGLKYTNFQAKMGLLQFSDKKYWEKLHKQNNNFNTFYQNLSLPPFLTKYMKPTYFLCFLILENNEDSINRLSKEKVYTTNFCYQDVNTLEFLKGNKANCPVAEKTIRSIVYFPFRYHLDKRDMQIIAKKFKKINPKIIQPQ